MTDETIDLADQIAKIDSQMKTIYQPMKAAEEKFKLIQSEWTTLANQKRKLEIQLWETSGKIKTKKLKVKKSKVKPQPKNFNKLLSEMQNKADLLSMIAQLEKQITNLAD